MIRVRVKRDRDGRYHVQRRFFGIWRDITRWYQSESDAIDWAEMYIKDEASRIKLRKGIKPSIVWKKKVRT